VYDQEWYEGRFDASMSLMSKALGLRFLHKSLEAAATHASIYAITMFITVCTQAIDDAARFPEYVWPTVNRNESPCWSFPDCGNAANVTPGYNDGLQPTNASAHPLHCRPNIHQHQRIREVALVVEKYQRCFEFKPHNCYRLNTAPVAPGRL